MKAIKKYLNNFFSKRYSNPNEAQNKSTQSNVNQFQSLTFHNQIFLSQLLSAQSLNRLPEFISSSFQNLPIDHLKLYYHYLYKKFNKHFLFITPNNTYNLFHKFKEEIISISLSVNENDKLNTIKEVNEKLNQLNYNQFQTISKEYNDSIYNINDDLIERNNKIIDLLINHKKNENDIQLYSLIKNTYSKLTNMYDHYSNHILRKIKSISRVNQTNQLKLSHKMNLINKYQCLMNDSMHLRQKQEVFKKIIINATDKSNKLIQEIVLNDFITKRKALTLTKRLGSFYFTFKESYNANSLKRDNFNRFKNVMSNILLVLRTKHQLILAIRRKDFIKLEYDLKEFEKYEISNSKQLIIKQLYVYCYINKLQNKVFECALIENKSNIQKGRM